MPYALSLAPWQGQEVFTGLHRPVPLPLIVSLEKALGEFSRFLRKKLEVLYEASSREKYYVATQLLSAQLHDYLADDLADVNPEALNRLTGLVFRDENGAPLHFPAFAVMRAPKFQVDKLRPARRAGLDGDVRS